MTMDGESTLLSSARSSPTCPIVGALIMVQTMHSAVLAASVRMTFTLETSSFSAIFSCVTPST